MTFVGSASREEPCVCEVFSVCVCWCGTAAAKAVKFCKEYRDLLERQTTSPRVGELAVLARRGGGKASRGGNWLGTG